MRAIYKPIDCGLHSEYELAIIHQQTLRVTWQEEKDILHCEILAPVDLMTKAGEEFMVVENSMGTRCQIRLDLILHAVAVKTTPLAGKPVP